MNKPRIRHLVQPPMSVVDRNFGSTNEVRTMMTSTALPMTSARGVSRQGGLELLISRLAVSMLRWSKRSSERRFTSLQRSVLVREGARSTSAAAEYSQLVRHVRLG
jgi:hypothetical protein